MQCKDNFAILLFESLSKLGLRDIMVSQLVFNPPLVSYTLRLIPQKHQKQEQQIDSPINHTNEPPPNRSQTEKSIHLSPYQNSNTSEALQHRQSVNDDLDEQESKLSQKTLQKLTEKKQSHPDLSLFEFESKGLDIPLCSSNYMYPIPIPEAIIQQTSLKQQSSKSVDGYSYFQRQLRVFSKDFKVVLGNIKSKPKNRITVMAEQDEFDKNPKIVFTAVRQSNKNIAKQYYTPQNQYLYPPHSFLLIDIDNQMAQVEPHENLNITSYILTTKNMNRIASVFIEIQETKIDYVLLFSHGNSTDLGYMLNTYLDLASNFNINVFGYEYSGYGQSTGKCTDIDAVFDLQSAYNFLVNELGFSQTKIILYGYSIGSGPSITLASSPKFVVGGLIIHSGLSSAMRILKQNLQVTSFNDAFPNIEFIQNVQCPVYILHGTADDEISIYHAIKLAGKCNRLYSIWLVQNAGHSNIDTQEEWRNQYYRRLQEFLHDIVQDNINYNEGFLRTQNTAQQLNKFHHCYNERLYSVFH